MKPKITIRASSPFGMLFFLVLSIGCGASEYAPVSGVVTVNGNPTAKVRVVFAPMATNDTSNSGPPSFAVTDETGRFELKTKDGYDGAVRGRHNVRFSYSDLKFMGDLKVWLGSATSKEDAANAKAAIAHVESETKKRGAISKKAMTTITVPADGLENADFEIGETEQEKKKRRR